jgi:hypothetical protein
VYTVAPWQGEGWKGVYFIYLQSAVYAIRGSVSVAVTIFWSIQAGTERIKEIFFALQSFSGFDACQMKKANLHEGLDSILRILQHRLNSPECSILNKT